MLHVFPLRVALCRIVVFQLHLTYVQITNCRKQITKSTRRLQTHKHTRYIELITIFIDIRLKSDIAAIFLFHSVLRQSNIFFSFVSDSISLTTMSNAQHNESVIIKNDKVNNIKKEDIDYHTETKTSDTTKTNKTNSHQTKTEKSPESLKSPSPIDTSSDDGKFGR